MLPVRSTTAAPSVSLFSADAATVNTARTSSDVRICAGPPALSDGVFCDRRRGAVATAIAPARKNRRTRGFYRYSGILERQRRLRQDGNPQASGAVRTEHGV